MTLPYSTRLTVPLTISPMRSLYSSYWRSRSASRTFCTMTCLADWAAMRPKSIGGSGSAMKSPTCGVGIALARVLDSAICLAIVLDRLDHLQQALQLDLAGLRVDLGADVGLLRRSAARAAFWIASSIAAMTIVLVDRLLARDRVGDLQQLQPVCTDCHCRLPERFGICRRVESHCRFRIRLRRSAVSARRGASCVPAAPSCPASAPRE